MLHETSRFDKIKGSDFKFVDFFSKFELKNTEIRYLWCQGVFCTKVSALIN